LSHGGQQTYRTTARYQRLHRTVEQARYQAHLVIRIADQHRPPDKISSVPTRRDIRKRDLVVTDRAELHHGISRARFRQPLKGLYDGLPWDWAQTLQSPFRITASSTAQLIRQCPPVCVYKCLQWEGVGDAAHGNEAVDDWVLLPRVAVMVDRGAACAVTGDGDSLWITAEVGNVVSDPFDGEALVEEPKVVFGQERGTREAEDVETVTKDVLENDCKTISQLATLTDYEEDPTFQSSKSTSKLKRRSKLSFRAFSLGDIAQSAMKNSS
jgi:hypothetical protein